MRLLFGLLALALPALAASHPSWWNYASPQATSLVGIRWAQVRSSPLGGAIGEELSSEGNLGFPDLECLKDAEQIVISAPELLAMEVGPFPAALLREQVGSRGWKHSAYRGVELWVTPGKETLSIARISDQLVLLGHVKTLQDAIDRSMEEDRAYSPLLAQAAHYANQDLWVIASHLPDPLANIFVPIDTEAESFAGSVSMTNGLHMEASVRGGSEKAAEEIADALRHDVPAMPSFGQGLRIDTDANVVRLTMEITTDQLASGLRKPEPTPALPSAPTPPKIEPPQIVRIWGLDDGPREFVLPHH